jgi:hypothetical protein
VIDDQPVDLGGVSERAHMPRALHDRHLNVGQGRREKIDDGPVGRAGRAADDQISNVGAVIAA